VRKDCVKAVLVCAERLCEGGIGMCGKTVKAVLVCAERLCEGGIGVCGKTV